MISSRLSNWISLIANVSILAGLILVAYELNQNSQLARIALINDGSAFENQLWTEMMGDIPGDVIAKAVECPELLTYSDFMAMDAFLFTSINIVYRNYEIAQEGLFTKSDWKGEVENYAHWYLDNEFGRAWWLEEGTHFFETEFSDYVSRQLEKEGLDSAEYWLRIRGRMESLSGSPIPRSQVCAVSEMSAN